MMSAGETLPVAITRTLWTAAGGGPDLLSRLEITGTGDLPSVFPVSDLATAAIGTAGTAIAELIAVRFGETFEG
jgi:hypothetical protein